MSELYYFLPDSGSHVRIAVEVIPSFVKRAARAGSVLSVDGDQIKHVATIGRPALGPDAAVARLRSALQWARAKTARGSVVSRITNGT